MRRLLQLPQRLICALRGHPFSSPQRSSAGIRAGTIGCSCGRDFMLVDPHPIGLPPGNRRVASR